MRVMLLDTPETSIDMKKLFAILGLILSAGICQAQETILYYNSFNDTESYDSLLVAVGGEMFGWTSGSIDQSYDGSPVLEATGGYTQTPTLNLHNDIDQVTVSVRVKRGFGQNAQFLLEYATVYPAEGTGMLPNWDTLFYGGATSYYHHIKQTIDLSWCETFTLRFKTIGGTGGHYVDDLFIKTPTPECDAYQECLVDTNEDNFINFNDMLNLLAAYGSICE